jgi:hypothetical protein
VLLYQFMFIFPLIPITLVHQTTTHITLNHQKETPLTHTFIVIDAYYKNPNLIGTKIQNQIKTNVQKHNWIETNIKWNLNT